METKDWVARVGKLKDLYVDWIMSHELANNGGLTQFCDFYKAAAKLKIPIEGKEREAFIFVAHFMLTLQDLARAPMAMEMWNYPRKGKEYQHYLVVTGTWTDRSGHVNTNYMQVALHGEKLNLGELAEAVGELRKFGENEEPKTQLPKLDQFEKCLATKVENVTGIFTR